jgi:hypothetical protein
MTPLELSVSDATIWSITVELSVTILESSFSVIYDVYSTGITYDDLQWKIIICLEYSGLYYKHILTIVSDDRK